MLLISIFWIIQQLSPILSNLKSPLNAYKNYQKVRNNHIPVPTVVSYHHHHVVSCVVFDQLLDLEWKVVYVGSAEDSHRDQVLEEVNVGPIPAGLHRFLLQTPAPRSDLIKNDDLIGVTVILITCSYLEQPFVQIGYYVNNEYEDAFEPENYPNPVDINKLKRNILADQPRVTRYMINWLGKPAVSPVPEEVANEPEPEDDVSSLSLEYMLCKRVIY